MPFKSKAQQRFLESSASPLSASEKKEWEGSTNFKNLAEKISHKMMASRKEKGKGREKK